MKNNTNYSRQTEQIAAKIIEKGGEPPRLLLHSCCAPCSSYCLEYLREIFRVTVFFYNPNITEPEEYEKRLEEEKRLIAEYNRQVDEQDFAGMHSTPSAKKISVLEAPYDPKAWLLAVRGLEACPEGGRRCEACFEMRLRATARAAVSAALKGTAEPSMPEKARAEVPTPAKNAAAALDPSAAGDPFPASEGSGQSFDYFTTTLTISPLKNAALLNGIGQRLSEEYGVKWLPSDFKKRDGYKRSLELSRQFGLYRQNYCGCVFSR